MKLITNKNETEIIGIKSENNLSNNKNFKTEEAMRCSVDKETILKSAEDVLKILLIHVGGTFGMLDSKDGYTTVPGQLKNRIFENTRLNINSDNLKEPAIYKVPNTNDKDIAQYDFIELNPIKDSTEAVAEDVIEIVEKIQHFYDIYDGFIVLHGTDTMTYIGSAVHYMIRNLTKPIVFTGSMIPMYQVDSDAIDNLANSFDWIIHNSTKPGVFLVFGALRALMKHAYKFDSQDKNGFYSIEPILKENYVRLRLPHINHKTIFLNKISNEVLVFKPTPFGISSDESRLRNALEEGLGVVIESYGNGNIPQAYVNLIREFHNRPVIIVSQCRIGKMNADYLCGKKLQDCENVIVCNNITLEAAVSGLSVFLKETDTYFNQVARVRELFKIYESYDSLPDSGCVSPEKD